MRLTKNLTLKEACRSESAKRLGIDNSPAQDQLDNLKITAEKIFQPIRDHFKCPVYVSSMFRSPELNNFLRLASKTSLHMSGQAIDIDMDGTDVSNEEIFNFVKDNLEFDTLIWEFEGPRWVHISYREGNNRNQVLESYKDDYGLTAYKIYEQKKKEVKRDKAVSIPTRKDRSSKQTSRHSN